MGVRRSKRVTGSVGLYLIAIAIGGLPAIAQAQYGPWFPGGYGRYQPEGSMRIQVTPREAEVYVDGYLVGTVDDFDGFSQRLRVPAGDHLIEIHLDGYQPISKAVFLQPDQTYRIRHAMQPLASGEATPPRPTPRATPPGSGPPAPNPGSRYGRRVPPDPTQQSASPTAGTLSIRVQPADAVVSIDGERWDGAAVNARLEVQVSPGPHRIEVQRDGYQPFTTTVTVQPGGATPLNVSQTPRPPGSE